MSNNQDSPIVIVEGKPYMTAEYAARRLGVAIGTVRNQTSLSNGFIKPAIHLGRQALYAIADVERVAAERAAR